MLVLLTIGSTALARVDTQEEYSSNFLANKIFESANVEAKNFINQIQEPFKDISFDVPNNAVRNTQITSSKSYSEDKFFYFTQDTRTNGVWIGANNSDSAITVDFDNHSVKVLDEYNGNGSNLYGTLVAYYVDGKTKPKFININAKDLSIKRNAGIIIYAYGNGSDKSGTINIETDNSIYFFAGKDNLESLISNNGGEVKLTSKDIALKAERGTIINATQSSLTSIKSESLLIEQEIGGDAIRALNGSVVEIEAVDLHAKSANQVYLLNSSLTGSKIDIIVNSAFLKGKILASDDAQIFIENSKLNLVGDIYSFGRGKIDFNLSNKRGSRNVIIGGVYSMGGSKVDINFGEGGLLQGGSVVVEAETTFTFGKGSVWLIKKHIYPDQPENFSSVTNLSLQGSFIDFTGNTANLYVSLIADNFDANSAVALMDVSIGQEKLNDKITVTKTASGSLGIHVPSNGIGDSSNGAESSGILVEVPIDQKDLSVSLISPTSVEGGVPVIDLGNYLYKLKTEEQGDKRVTYLAPLFEPEPIDPDPVPDVPPSDVPSTDPAPTPVYSPTAEAVLAMAGMGAQSGFYQNQLTDVRKRLGEIRSGVRDGLWASVAGQKDRITGFVGTHFKQDVYRFNFGVDSVVGNWILGGNFKYLNADQKTRDTYFNAKGEAHSEGLNLYATWQNEKGCYADFILSADRYHQRINNTMLDGTGVKGTYRNLGLGVSAEVGKKFSIDDAQTWFAEPQLQLSYYHVKGDNFTMSNGMKVEQGNFNSLTGRIGLAAGHEVRDSDGQSKGLVYLRTGLKHEFLGKQTLHVNNEKFRDKLVGTRAYYGVATDWRLTKNLKVYGHVERENGSHYTKEIEVMAGVKYSF